MSYTDSTWKTSYDSKKPEFHPYFNPSDSPSFYSGNHIMFDDESFVNNNHQSSDAQTLQTIQRKISKQKIAAGNVY
jgi:hypothetical protein